MTIEQERELASAVITLAIRDFRSGGKEDRETASRFLFSNQKEWSDVRKFWFQVLDLDERILEKLRR